LTEVVAFNRSDERQRWSRFYAERLAAQLRQAVALMDHAPPHAMRSHFDSYLSLLNATVARPDLVEPWLALVDRLHPQPVRWGQWAAWLAVLRRAADKAAEACQPARQAEYMAYAADLLLNTGQLTTALDMARAAGGLARSVLAAWPLSVAGSVAAAGLRALARYDDAQAVLDRTRAEVAIMPTQPAARAALAAALLDHEELRLLRYFRRLDAALALSTSVVENLSAVPGIDPHDLARAYVRRATVTWAADRYQAAADDLRRAAALFRQAGDELQAVFAEGDLGLVYLSMSRYAEAEALKLAAIRAAEEMNARRVLVSELGDISVVYIGLGRMDLAFDYADRMVALATELGNEAELSRGRGNRAYALLGLGRYDEALPDIEVSLRRYREQGRHEGAIVTTIDMILYLRGTGKEEQAAHLAQENYAAALKESLPRLHVITARCLALFLPLPQREALLRQTLALARQHERPMDEAGCLFSLAASTANVQERQALYQQAVAIVEQMGCTGWLVGRSEAEPPLLPMLI
jgi:tetratricopeptide (TPR) repeat protein